MPDKPINSSTNPAEPSGSDKSDSTRGRSNNKPSNRRRSSSKGKRVKGSHSERDHVTSQPTNQHASQYAKKRLAKKIDKLISKIPHYLALMRMDKPIGTLLLLWPTLWALWVAGEGNPDAYYVWIFTLGGLVMRSAGCVINDYADREYDPLVKRTKQRPIAAGFVKPREALVLFVALGFMALILLLLLPVRVWPWSLLAIALTIAYPFTKRIFDAPQLILSIAFSVSMIMAYVAFDKPFDSALIVMFLMNLIWVVMFDTQYAMSDRDDDLLVGVKSTAILFAHRDKLIIAGLQASVVVLLFVLMELLSLANGFYVSIALVVGLFVYQQWLIRDRERLPCFDAFLNNAWVGGVIWFGLLTAL